ncbi:MAG: MBL fold metallo-hydrolase, partial [Coriobacteriia bacterium]|nr:MBL fold metallo-hydrolase [Coriobacteriia bacterium]
CIFTPGHTDGSACYVVDGRYLFTGDTLKLEEGSVTLFYDVFNMDNDTQEQSIRKLAGLKGIEAVFTMHNGYTTDFNTAFEGWFD